MSAAGARPVPVVSDVSRPYWEGCRRGVLLVQECGRCGHRQLYPRSVCSACHSRDLSFIESAGKGTIVSFTVVHRAASSAFADDVPYVLALVRLDEGPTMMSTVTDTAPEAVTIDMPVRVWFDASNDEIALPRFRPNDMVGP